LLFAAPHAGVVESAVASRHECLLHGKQPTEPPTRKSAKHRVASQLLWRFGALAVNAVAVLGDASWTNAVALPGVCGRESFQHAEVVVFDDNDENPPPRWLVYGITAAAGVSVLSLMAMALWLLFAYWVPARWLP
jgi:hypothetical protein